MAGEEEFSGSVLAQFFSAGPTYDAMLHTIFLGFVFSMIFAHAPIILPTITGLALPFQNIFYLHAALLHLSLMLRVAGDLFRPRLLCNNGLVCSMPGRSYFSCSANVRAGDFKRASVRFEKA